jgi:photosystem II stability/assembly factor-like uncharacterized protein
LLLAGILATLLLFTSCGPRGADETVPGGDAVDQAAPPDQTELPAVWSRVWIEPNIELQDVSFIDAKNGVAVGWAEKQDGSFGSVVVKTQDGGKTWLSYYPALKPGLARDFDILDSVFPVDKKLWYAAGYVFHADGTTTGVILKTNDAGDVWTEVTPMVANASSVSFNHIFFLDAEHGWVVGDHDGGATLILYTSDGGKIWVEPFTREQTQLFSLDQVFFVNATTGWIVGSDEVMYTKDGGKTWTFHLLCPPPGSVRVLPEDLLAGPPVITVGPPIGPQDGLMRYKRGTFFLDEMTGWLAGYAVDGDEIGGTILTTTDGGKTWTEQLSAEMSGQYVGDQVYFVDKNHGWALCFGSEDHLGVILRTKDGGRLWEIEISELDGKPFLGIKDIYFLDENHGWAVGMAGQVLRFGQ